MQVSEISCAISYGKWPPIAAVQQDGKEADLSVGILTEDNGKTGADIAGVSAAKKDDSAKKSAQNPKTEEDKGKTACRQDDTRLNFKLHKGTGVIMIQIVDDATGDVLREIPPERILDSIAQIWKNSGINVDRTV